MMKKNNELSFNYRKKRSKTISTHCLWAKIEFIESEKLIRLTYITYDFYPECFSMPQPVYNIVAGDKVYKGKLPFTHNYLKIKNYPIKFNKHRNANNWSNYKKSNSSAEASINQYHKQYKRDVQKLLDERKPYFNVSYGNGTKYFNRVSAIPGLETYLAYDDPPWKGLGVSWGTTFFDPGYMRFDTPFASTGERRVEIEQLPPCKYWSDLAEFPVINIIATNYINHLVTTGSMQAKYLGTLIPYGSTFKKIKKRPKKPMRFDLHYLIGKIESTLNTYKDDMVNYLLYDQGIIDRLFSNGDADTIATAHLVLMEGLTVFFASVINKLTAELGAYEVIPSVSFVIESFTTLLMEDFTVGATVVSGGILAGSAIMIAAIGAIWYAAYYLMTKKDEYEQEIEWEIKHEDSCVETVINSKTKALMVRGEGYIGVDDTPEYYVMLDKPGYHVCGYEWDHMYRLNYTSKYIAFISNYSFGHHTVYKANPKSILCLNGTPGNAIVQKDWQYFHGDNFQWLPIGGVNG